jgi:hypothetical protein
MFRELRICTFKGIFFTGEFLNVRFCGFVFISLAERKQNYNVISYVTSKCHLTIRKLTQMMYIVICVTNNYSLVSLSTRSGSRDMFWP